jgi:beta-lactam-binding protein with PASTA domain
LAVSKVKENRKIYITLNPSGYRKMNIPEGLIDQTYRQVKPTLEALGFKVGRITYVDNIGKDIVLKLSHDGKTLNPGDKLARTSKIDLVLGNGNRP